MGFCRRFRTDALQAVNLSGDYERKLNEEFDSNARQRSIALTLSIRHPGAQAPVQPSSPKPTDLSKALAQWKSVQRASGIQGVRETSRTCFERAARTLSWLDVDECVAIDKFASVLDDGMHSAAGTPTDPYFTGEVMIARWTAMLDRLPGDRAANISRITEVSQRSEKLLLASGPP